MIKGKSDYLIANDRFLGYVEALKQHNIEMDKRKISIKGEVTGPGLYEAVIKVHPEITTTIKVEVTAN